MSLLIILASLQFLLSSAYLLMHLSPNKLARSIIYESNYLLQKFVYGLP